MEKKLGNCQPFQEIKPTPTPPKKEGRLNLYQGLRAIHSTYFRGCTHTRSGVKRVKVSKSKSISDSQFSQSNIIIYILISTLVTT